jgi:hypothetical protein
LTHSNENFDNLHSISLEEVSIAEEQPARNSLSSENEKGVGQNPTSFNQIHFLSHA